MTDDNVTMAQMMTYVGGVLDKRFDALRLEMCAMFAKLEGQIDNQRTQYMTATEINALFALHESRLDNALHDHGKDYKDFDDDMKSLKTDVEALKSKVYTAVGIAVVLSVLFGAVVNRLVSLVG